MRTAFALLIATLVAAPAAAQLPDHPLSNANGTVTVGAEVSGSLSRRDDAAFFNYTDYDSDALRMARVRLMSEWRPHAQWSLVGELRVGTNTTTEVAALFARWRPVATWNFDIEAGRVPPVIGAFARRAYGRDNPLVGIPLAYQYLTSLRPDALPLTVDDILRMRARGWRPSYPLGSDATAPGLALVSASHWDTGVVAHWSSDRVDLAASLTRGAPAKPVVTDTNDGVQWSGRAALMFPAGVTVGVSGARGIWINRAVLDLRPIAAGVSTTQTVVGADASLERGHWIVRGEYLHVTFGIPVANEPSFTTPLEADTGFIEARYRFLSRWQIAARAERLTFSDVRGTLFDGAATPWDAPVKRLEVTAALRIARTLEVRGGYQYNWRDGGRVRTLGFPTLQLLYWF
jgi:hypothetical protein